MFVGGVAIPEERLEELEGIGLKDSKKLSDRKRRELEPEIRKIGHSFSVREITEDEIDELSEIMSLNVIEIMAFAGIIEELEPEKAIIDLPEPDGEKFARKIKKQLPERFLDMEIVAEHGADDSFPVVSAASILAKNAREDHVEKLREKYGRVFGSGYPHDKEATGFIREFYTREGVFPDEARETWSTCRRMVDEKEQSSIFDF